MPLIKLIADSGATSTDWVLLNNKKTTTISTTGISPYLMDTAAIAALLEAQLVPKLKGVTIDEIYYYGTGCSGAENRKRIQVALKKVFQAKNIQIKTDMEAAAISMSAGEKSITCILGTGSNSAYFNGKKVIKSNPSLGFILGDEGSGAWLGRKVIQYFLNKTFDAELASKFTEMFNVDYADILDKVYRQPLPNRYLASFAVFLSENRGHYMVENILEDGINDFITQHLFKYRESWLYPIHFCGSIAYNFRDVLLETLQNYELEAGKIVCSPIEGLVQYHKNH